MNYKNDQIKKLLAFLGPRAKKIWEKELENSHPIFLPFEIVDNWEKHRKNKEVVELFYDVLEFMNVEVPDYLRAEELDWRLFLRILDFHHPKSGSFVDLAIEIGINKDTLKKILSRVNPELSKKLRNRKKLSALENYEILEILGVYNDIAEDEQEEEAFLNSTFPRRSDVYKLLNTDKKTLESNISDSLKLKINGLDRIPPVLYQEIRDELNGC